jgi:hypothetical protein
MEPGMKPTPPWVKLHLAKQSESCQMPPFLIGQLVQELPSSLCLSNVLEPVADEKAPGGFKIVERKFPDYVYRTYVYRMEMLGIRPDLEDFGSATNDEGGGMG